MTYCKKHPKYQAIQKPRSTKNYPDGCPDCWEQYSIEHYSEIDGVQVYCGGCEKTSVTEVHSINSATLEAVVLCPLCGVGVQWDLGATY